MEEQISYTITLPGVDRPAVVVITRAASISAAREDGITARWEVHLPAWQRRSAGPLVLDVDLWLSNVECGGRPLTESWGWPHEGNSSRYIWGYESGPSMEVAIVAAMWSAADALRPLVAALERRQVR